MDAVSRRASCRKIGIVLFLLAILACWGTGAQAADPAGSALKDDMRLLWQRADEGGFLRHWLVCGEFPNPNATGLEIDYLTAQGGEARIHPWPGMAERRPDGTAAIWTEETSPDDVFDLLKAFPDRPTENVAGYAYSEILWPRTEMAVLSVGSDDGVKVWVNGVVALDHAIRRGVTKDEDQVEVPLKAGRNSLLVKVEQGAAAWGFAVRFLSKAKLLLLPPRGVSVTASGPDAGNPGMLTVELGKTSLSSDSVQPPVTVNVIAAGGAMMATRISPAGSELRWPMDAWPEGVYDIRATAPQPDGRASTAYTMWYHGDALAAAERLLSAASGADRDSQTGIVLSMLAELVHDKLGKDLSHAKREDLPSVYSALMEWEELQMDGGRGAIRPNGFVRLAYRDPVDDSPQYCRAYLPLDYSPTQKWPMVVHLHGYNPDNPPYVKWGIDGRHHGWADTYGVIVLEPMGRYNTTFWGIGEKDVIRSIQLAKEQLSVDDDRVYLVGESMGGGGTWYVGTRHPELFAAIAPQFGGHDYHADLTDEQAAKLSPHDRYRVEARSMFVQAESLLTTPVFVNHGDKDDIVKVGYSRYAVGLLQRWGYNVRYWEHPGSGHGGFNVDDDMMRWLLPLRRVSAPRHVRLRAAEVASASAHWIRVEQCLDPWQLMNVDAEVTGPNVIRLDTENVARITLSPPQVLVDSAAPLQIVWNGKDVRTVDLSHGPVTMNVEGYTPSPGGKTPERFGRMDDVYRTPFAIVVGTRSKNPVMQRFVQRAADRIVAWWRQWQHVVPRVYRDTDLTAEDAAKYSLVLLGGPAENSVTRNFGNRLPLKVLPHGFRIDGKDFVAKDALAQVVSPNPLNAARYIAVIAADSPAGMYLMARLPGDLDYAVVDGRVPDPDADRPDSKVRIAGGMFNNAWHFEGAFLELGDHTVRAASPMRKPPTRFSFITPDKHLELSEVLETAAEGTFASMMRDGNWLGEPIVLDGVRYAHGIGVQTSPDPCSVTYDLTGAGWNHLRSLLGIEVDAPKLSQQEKDNTLVQFVVAGDGKELYRSPMLHWDSKPQLLDLDIHAVKVLKLSVITGATWHNAARSVDWADLRVER